jgi:hypothetical protein
MYCFVFVEQEIKYVWRRRGSFVGVVCCLWFVAGFGFVCVESISNKPYCCSIIIMNQLTNQSPLIKINNRINCCTPIKTNNTGRL